MKYLFASDLHGSLSAAETVLERLSAEKADRLILLGDLLYHGPRNDLPDRYDPKSVAALFNAMPVKPVAVRGNCDAEIDQMVLDFPIMADYMLLPLVGNHTAFVTHGHLFNMGVRPPYRHGDLLIHGHTHVHTVVTDDGLTYVNPGSAALPKEGQPKSYMTLEWEKGLFEIKTFDGDVLQSYTVGEDGE
ncbi:MAG: phosphodiesterase [Eubacteriales bacterium]|nr:phosphodiesterase [Eubacteriales bacterium]